MKLIIAGSRTITDIKWIRKAIHKNNISIDNIEQIVSGGARGVDLLGEKFANKFSIPVKRFPANWIRYGNSAGYIRNSEMAKYADCLLAIWDGQSNGTKHMINLMKKENKTVFIYIP